MRCAVFCLEMFASPAGMVMGKCCRPWPYDAGITVAKVGVGRKDSWYATRRRRSDFHFLARALNPSPPPPQHQQQKQDEDNANTNTNAFSSPADLNYLWKLAAGSVGGAAVIKYGSILFPDLTRPNFLQALLMILTPVLVSILILIKQNSATESQDAF